MNTSPTNVTQDIKAPADAQTAYPPVARQSSGIGKRVGSIAEVTFIAALKPAGAARFRERLAKYQADAWHREALV